MVYFYMLVNEMEIVEKKLTDIKHRVGLESKKLEFIAKDLGEFEQLQKIQFEELKNTEAKIKRLLLNHSDKVIELNDLNSKLKETEEILAKTKVIKIIVVDNKRSDFISNGLVSLNRDILMKLLRICFDLDKARKVVGMTSLFYTWSKLQIFHWALKEVLEFVWSEFHKEDSIEVLDEGKTARSPESFGSVASHLITVGNNKVTHGIVVLSIRITKMPSRDTETIGILTELPKTYQEGFLRRRSKGKKLLGWGITAADFGVFCQAKKLREASYRFCEGDLVTIRVDVNRGDLEFRVNGRPYASPLFGVTEIKTGVYLAAELGRGTEMQVVSARYSE